ncbi:MAG: glycosyltransferase family 39 protein [Candidatus Bathyarchaeia archaeon]
MPLFSKTKRRPIVLRVPSFTLSLKRVFEDKLRFVIPIVALSITKIASALWIYSRFPHPLPHQGFASFGNVFDVFANWDTIFFMQNLTFKPYPPHMDGAYAFLPGYSLVIWAVYAVTRNMGVATALPALIFGIAWLPLFQAVAESYMSRNEALGCTLMTAFFPYVFVFTTVAYSEPLFMFACVASWYFYRRDKTLHAGFLAAVAAITRLYGIFLSVPMLLDLLIKRRWKRLPHILVPAAALLGWFYFCYTKTGDWLASHTAGTFFGPPGQEWVLGKLIPFFSGSHKLFVQAEMMLIGIVGLLAFLCWNFDWRLSVYSIITFLGIVTLAGYLPSYPRFFSFIFPIWLNLKTRNRILVFLVCALFFPHALWLWYQFHAGIP